MGTFAGLYGEYRVTEEKREELACRALEVFRRGGMVKVNNVELFGKKLILLGSPRFDDEGMAIVSYNIFQDDIEEEMSFYRDAGWFSSHKIGDGSICRVARAMHVLLEFYSKDFVCGEVNGKVLDEQLNIGWLNYLFDEQYTNKRAEDIRKIYALMENSRKDESDPITADLSHLTFACFSGRSKAMLDNALDFLLYPEIRFRPSDENFFPTDVAIKYILALCELESSSGIDEASKIAALKEEFLNLNTETLKPSNDFIDGIIPVGIYTLPRDYAIRVIAETFGISKKCFADDVQEAEPDISHIWYTEEGLKPIPKIKTRLAFEDIYDDDLAYFWEPGKDDIVFSDEMKAWMEELKTEFDSILEDIELIRPSAFMQELINVLTDASRLFIRIFAYEEMFYEFIDRVDDKKVQAAVVLLRRMVERNRENPLKYDLYFPYKTEPRLSPVRLQFKRYLAIMANKALRMQIFEF